MSDHNPPSEAGRLVDVPASRLFTHEAHSFTPWLAENLDRLAEVVGTPLELVDQEVNVQGFSADIVARDPRNDARVLIENQIGPADHKHLGQILIYLAGLEAKSAIWIATEFHPARLSAIRWLNQHTTEEFSFFAVQLRVVQIGDSALAPLFDIVERPNNWERAVQEQARSSGELSERGQFMREFWTYAIGRQPSLAMGHSVDALNYRWLPVPELDVLISIYVYKKGIGIYVRGPRGTDRSHVVAALGPKTDALEKLLGVSRDKDFGTGLSIASHDRANWDAMSDWLCEKLENYRIALAKLVEELPYSP